MIDGKTVLGVIPARGGSKRFPGKNIAQFRGRPLIAWTILAAQKSRFIDTLICSTDHIDIELVALVHGCKVIRRPLELATDTAKSEDVLRHALSLLPHDYVVLLQPTSPLRTTEDIDACLSMGRSISVCDGKTNGAVYVSESEWLKKHDFTEVSRTYSMPQERSLDINTPQDIECYVTGS